MHLILTGATGLIGSAVLDAMLKTKDISKITILSRRAVRMADDARDPRVQVILHQDFEKYDDESLWSRIEDANGCVWALGIGQNDVGKEEYVKITKNFALRFAEAFQQARAKTNTTNDNNTKPFQFVFVSGEGATHSPGLFTPLFGRVKGETELALAALNDDPSQPGGFRAVTVRPAAVDGSAHAAIRAYVPRLGVLRGTMTAVLGPVMRTRPFRDYLSPTEPLGRFLTEVAMGKWEGPGVEGPGVERTGPGESGGVVIGNAGFVRLAGLGKS